MIIKYENSTPKCTFGELVPGNVCSKGGLTFLVTKRLIHKNWYFNATCLEDGSYTTFADEVEVVPQLGAYVVLPNKEEVKEE